MPVFEERTELTLATVKFEAEVIEVRTDRVVTRDGEEISRAADRSVLKRGDDRSGLDPRLRAIADALWGQ
jgi:hypothetical protein